MTHPLLGPSIAISNALCSLSAVAEGRGHGLTAARITAVRSAFTRWSCRLLLNHPRVIYGTARDICLDCLTVLDEHPEGRR